MLAAFWGAPVSRVWGWPYQMSGSLGESPVADVTGADCVDPAVAPTPKNFCQVCTRHTVPHDCRCWGEARQSDAAVGRSFAILPLLLYRASNSAYSTSDQLIRTATPRGTVSSFSSNTRDPSSLRTNVSRR